MPVTLFFRCIYVHFLSRTLQINTCRFINCLSVLMFSSPLSSDLHSNSRVVTRSFLLRFPQNHVVQCCLIRKSKSVNLSHCLICRYLILFHLQILLCFICNLNHCFICQSYSLSHLQISHSVFICKSHCFICKSHSPCFFL